MSDSWKQRAGTTKQADSRDNLAMAIELRPYLKRISLKPSEEQRDSFPFDLPAVRAITNIEFDRDVTFFVGENGSGKSTVLEAIAVAMGLSPQGGTRDYTAEDRFGLSPLHEHLRITRSYKPPLDRFYLRAESLFSLADYLHSTNLKQPCPPSASSPR